MCFLKLLFYGSYIRWIDYKYCLCLFSYHLINLKPYPYIDSTWWHQNNLKLIIWQWNKCLQMFSKFWTDCWIIILISYCGTLFIQLSRVRVVIATQNCLRWLRSMRRAVARDLLYTISRYVQSWEMISKENDHSWWFPLPRGACYAEVVSEGFHCTVILLQ